MHYYRLGSGARIPLQISAAVAALATDTVAMDANKFAWDPTNNWIDIDNTNGMPLKLLAVSTTGNLAAVQDPTTKSVNWDTTKPVGLFLI
ncbi:hypothetical protein [Budvicia aquatica]|uniref:Uncharacterized protein n=1 Tax=Budvicia aquatica TaxID=82979 RepID=A0A484ZSS2_9GAMM|nr:hypothetical protein [Budvicia aquatica]VFS51424.1 Uncharacterised protein [Budvicia aquatica]